MRLLQVGYNVSSAAGGTPRAIYDIRDALGGEIVSFTGSDLPRDRDDGVIHVAHSRTLAGRLYGWSGDTGPIARHVERCSVLMIHGLYRHHFQWAVGRAREFQRPYLIYAHGSLDPHVFTYRAVQKKLWWRWVGRPAARDSAGLVFVTAAEAAKAAPLLPREAPRHVVPLPIAAAPAQARARLRERGLQQLGLGPDARVVLYLGRLDPFKRLPVLIEAFNRSNPAGWNLVIAGPESAELPVAACRGRVAPHVRERVFFPGPRFGEDKEALYAAADAYVSISARENFGYSVGEALAREIPVLLGPGNDLAPELRDVDCGWLLDRDDAADVARALTAVAACSAEQRAQMGARGRAWVDRHLSPPQVAARLRTVCEGFK